MREAWAMTDPSSRTAFIELDRTECERLLASQEVGRLAVVADGAPHVIPVNYATPGGGVVVFRTVAGSILTEASLRRVAFEVDEVDRATRSGWSVEVRGVGRDIADAVDAESVRLRQLPLVTWAPGERQQWFKIVPDAVTGRRLTPM
jgi:nitroimidazol reductase NimA-like FMN-containing flavoprotein (pyridoxamine 5'-phosphate oxidase superfamily)